MVFMVGGAGLAGVWRGRCWGLLWSDSVATRLRRDGLGGELDGQMGVVYSVAYSILRASVYSAMRVPFTI